MDTKRLWEEYSNLPAKAQEQVVEFLAFLKAHYADKTARTAHQRIDWQNEPFIGMWRDRDDMQESSRWVRETREREWSRGGESPSSPNNMSS